MARHGRCDNVTPSILAPRPKYVVCIDNADYLASLELHKIYRTLPDADASRSGDLRIVDESGEDYLYPATGFVAINPPKRVRFSLQRAD